MREAIAMSGMWAGKAPLSVCLPRYRFQQPPRARALAQAQLGGVVWALGSGAVAVFLLGLMTEQARLLLVSSVMLAAGGGGLAWHGWHGFWRGLRHVAGHGRIS